MNYFKSIFLGIVLSTALHSGPTPVDINLQNLQITDFIKMVSKITNKNILITTNIPGTVNFVSSRTIYKEEVYELLQSVLNSKGFTLIDTKNGYLEVVRSTEASKVSPQLKTEQNLSQIQTDIIHVQYQNAAILLPQVKFLQSKYGRGIASVKSNALILSDFPSNLLAVRELISKLDLEQKNEVEFFPLQNASSSSVVPKLLKITTKIYDPKIENQKIEILDDEGSNTVIVIAKKDQIEVIKNYIVSLDKEDEVAEQKISIVPLKNSNAESVAKTLETIISGKVIKKGEIKPKITFDSETNTVILISSQKELEQFKLLIEKLDVDRQQVFVRARIIEISSDKAKKIGAKYGVLGGVADSSGLYSLSANLGGSALPVNFVDLGIELPDITKGIALGATVSLLQSNGAAEILSEPSLLCINNLESSIYVGQTESIISQGTIDSSTTDITKNTYTRQDIGLTLTLKPRISTANKVTLDVKTILEDIVPGSQAGLPTTTKREVKTTAIVNNGESIIIGGLVREKQDIDETKIPILGDIPILGEAFRHEEKSTDKVSLVVILTPYIVSKSADLGKLRSALGKLSTLEDEFARDFAKKAGEEK